MIGISALTEFSTDESDEEPLAEVTKEAKESEAFALYTQALHEQRSSDFKKAENLYHSLLKSGFLEEVEVPEEDGEPLVDPAAILKYSAYKNLGNLALERGDQRQGVEYLLEAVSLDSTDVSLWYKIGQVAVKLMNLPLANISLREGLRCNPNHWPSLDCIITVLYTISDYSSCLSYVAKILERDAKHLKAHAFKTQILKEDAYLRRHADAIFKNCPESVHNFRIKKDVLEKYVGVALKMREERRQLAETPPLPVLKFRNSFKEFTWRHLGEQLINLYDYLRQADPHISFGCRVDLSPQPQEDGDSCEEPRAVHWAPHSEGSTTPGELSERHSGGESGVTGGNTRPLSSSESHTQTTDISGAEMEEVREKSHKSHKKKRGIFWEPAPGKRRSARVRNTEKKKEVIETVDYQELLLRFLPSTLVQSNSEDPADIFGSPTSQPKRQSANTSDLPDLPTTSDLGEVEGHDVEQFMKQHEKNSGVASLMREYLVCLSKQFHLNWPRKLSTVYTDVYNRMRNHITIPAIFFQDDSDEYKRNLGVVMLVYMELCVDKWRRSKTQDVRWGKFVQPDMVYLEHLGVMEGLMEEMWPEYPVRVHWMRARYFVLDGKTAEAVNAYNVCHDLLETFDLNSNFVYLPNIHEDKIITKDIVEGRKDTLRRTQSHEEIKRLFEEENYERVVDILLAVMDSPRSDEDEGELIKQRMMLVMALLKIEDHKNLVVCFCKILKEFWDKMQGLEEQPDKVKILRKLDKFFDMLVSSPALSTNLFQATNHKVAGQLAYVLIDVIDWTMRTFKPPEEGLDPPAPTVLPWVVLYFLLKSEEDKLEAQKIPGIPDTVIMATDDCSSDSTEALLPSSIMLLETAHESLGRKSWCCNSEGAFLKLTATVLLRELNKFPEDQTHPFAEDLQQLLEQCFYCLYGHPNRRAKAKHLQDHGVEEVPLTWEYGKFMFNYFKPRMLPEFDGYKTSAMSGDLENLFLRITKVIPMKQRPADSVEKIQAYVDGTSDDTPVLADNIKPSSPVVSEIFYLLADYYFKNKEFGKATKFYIHDICFCPSRLDSWAGLALAKSGKLELKINSCDAKAEGGVYKQGMGSLKCFHRALEIDQSNRSLWIEYGSFAYILQSHASRQLKHRDQIQLSEESIKGLKLKQDEMLNLSGECFRKVKEMGGDEEGEEWLIHYMLGKIAEKRGKIRAALDHYLEAMDHLYNDGAKFPKKISYHNPPDLALESLEMYFRIHAAVLKALEKGQSNLEDIAFDTYEEVLHLASIQPFVKRQEKKLSELSSEVSTDEQEVPAKPAPPALPILINGSPLLSPPYVTAPQDHDYARIKNLQKRRPVDYEDIQTDTPSEADVLSSEESAPSAEDESHTAFLLHKLFPHAKGDFPLLTKQSPQQLSPSSAPRGPAPALTRETEPKEDVAMDMGEVNLGHGKEENLSPEGRFGRLVTQCLKAMGICLQRFSQHYKSLYRITHWYLMSHRERNLQWCYDLLLGSTAPWQRVPHLPAPALFGEHSKTKNIFQGIWRIPIADIDRSGSFSWHMYRSVTLLIEVLEAMRDDSMLLQMATKLARTPDQGKKFLRDSDRPHLALRAFHTCQKLLAADAALAPSLSEDGKSNLLMKIWSTQQVGQQLPLRSESDIANKSLVNVYKSLKNVKISDDLSILDQAVRACQLRMTTSRTPQAPYQSDTIRTGRPGSQGSPVRAPVDRPGTSAQYLERLYGIRSPGSLGLAPSVQPRKSPDRSPGGSFMMSRILAADPERKTTILGREGTHNDDPSRTKAGSSPVPVPERKTVTQGRGGSSKASLSLPKAGPSVTKAGLSLAKAGMSVNKMTKKPVTMPLTESDKPEREGSKTSNKPVGLGTAATGPPVLSLHQKMTMDLSKSDKLGSANQELGTVSGGSTAKEDFRSVKLTVDTSGIQSFPGSMKASVNSSDEPQPRGQRVERITPCPVLPPAPRPDLGQHLNSLLQKVRTGLKITNKTSWKKLAGHGGGHPALARTTAHQGEEVGRETVPGKMSPTEDPRAKASGNVTDSPAEIAGRLLSKDGARRPTVSLKGLVVSEPRGISTTTVGTFVQAESTDSKRSEPRLSDDSEEEKARFDAILNSLKTSGGTVGGSEDRSMGVSKTTAVSTSIRRSDELADILDSLESDEPKTSRKSTLSSKGSLGVHQNVSGDAAPSLFVSRQGCEEGSASMSEEGKEAPQNQKREGGVVSYDEISGLFPSKSKGSDPTDHKTSSPTNVADESEANKALREIVIDAPAVSQNAPVELTGVLRSLSQPRPQATDERGSLSADVAQNVGMNRGAKMEGSMLSSKPSRVELSSDTGRKRSRSYIELLKSLKRRRVAHVDKRKESSSSSGQPASSHGAEMNVAEGLLVVTGSAKDPGSTSQASNKPESRPVGGGDTPEGSGVPGGSYIELLKSLKRRRVAHVDKRKESSSSSGQPASSHGAEMNVAEGLLVVTGSAKDPGSASQASNKPESRPVGGGDTPEGSGVPGGSSNSSEMAGILEQGTKASDEIPLSELKLISPTETVSPVDYLSPKRIRSNESDGNADGSNCKNLDEIPLIRLRETQGSQSDNIPLSEIGVGPSVGTVPSGVSQGPVKDHQRPGGSLQGPSDSMHRSGERITQGSPSDDVPLRRIGVVSSEKATIPSDNQGPGKGGQGLGTSPKDREKVQGSPSEDVPLSKISVSSSRRADPKGPSTVLQVEGREALGDFQGSQSSSGKRKHSADDGDSMEGDHKRKSMREDEFPLCQLGDSPLAGYSAHCLTPKKAEGDSVGQQAHESPSDNVPLSELAESEETH